MPVDQPGDQACRVFADAVHRQGCRYACLVATTGPRPSINQVTKYAEDPTVIRRQGCRHACGYATTGPSGSDGADQRGDQACRGDAATGPSDSDCAEDRESPADAARDRMHVQIMDVPVLHTALQERTLERMHEQIVDVPVPHGAQLAEIPQNLYVDTVVDMPVVIQRQVPQIQTARKTVYVPSINEVTKHAEFPQIYIDKVVDSPVVMQRKVPQIQTVLKTVEIPPAQRATREDLRLLDHLSQQWRRTNCMTPRLFVGITFTRRKRERDSSSVAAHQFPFCSVILEATPQLGIALRKSGGERHTRRPTTEMMDPGSESGQSR